MDQRSNKGHIQGAIDSITMKQHERILMQMKKSICKINGKSIGTGFFCITNYENKDIPCLMTNYSILDDNYIKQNKNIKISMNDNQINENITLNEKDILYLSKENEYDLIIIKLKNDKEYIDYLKLDDDLFNKNSEKKYNNECIYILHYPNSNNNESSISYGYGIASKNNFDIEHKCNAKPSSSGSPILNLSSNKVIGIHKGCIDIKYNIGSLLKYPLNELNKKNEIKLEIEIKKEDINKEIIILSSCTFIYKDTIKKANKEINESNTELYINNEKRRYNNYFYPKKEGIYSVKLKFNFYMKSCYGMFHDCKNIINIDFLNFDTRIVDDMGHMFDECINLKKIIGLSSFDTKNVTNMDNMFNLCKSLENIDLLSFDTKNVTNMHAMFCNCQNLENIDLSAFDTKNVTDMWFMFCGCEKLKSIDLSFFNTENVKTIGDLFRRCKNLKIINLSSFDTKNVTNMGRMFDNCDSLECVDISSFEYNKIEFGPSFKGCQKLREVKIKKKFYEKYSYIFEDLPNVSKIF